MKFKDLKKGLTYHLVDSTAILAAIAPIWAVFDTSIGMEDEVSIMAKVNSALITYAGSGWLYGKLRDVSKRHFDITDKTKERIQGLHDFLYNATYSGILTGLVYTASREPDIKKIGAAMAFAVGTAIVRGPIAGYSIDVGRDLAGLEECDRRLYPKIVKRRTPKLKLAIAASLIVSSLGMQALTYCLTPDKIDWFQNSPNQDQITETQREDNLGNLERTIFEDKQNEI
ncbi:MAG: hypothetical protein ABIE22_04565 [archaeon]